MMVTVFRCWWQNQYVDDFFNAIDRSKISQIGYHIISNLSLIHFVTNIGHKHRWSRYEPSRPIFWQVLSADPYLGPYFLQIKLWPFIKWSNREFEGEIDVGDGCWSSFVLEESLEYRTLPISFNQCFIYWHDLIYFNLNRRYSEFLENSKFFI